MRFHVANLPHTETVISQSSCAYTNKVRRFCDMMISLGHEVYLYAGSNNDANCTEHIVIMPKERQRHYWGKAVDEPGYPALEWNNWQPYWDERNNRAIEEISKRIKPQDFIIFFDGRGGPVMSKFLSVAQTVEAGIGYSGTFSPYRVWESYAWMHGVYGEQAVRNGGSIMSVYGQNYESVIYNSYDPSEFEPSDTPISDRDYFLYIGRLVPEKGIEVAEAACKAAGVKLLLAGKGDYQTTYGEKVGLVGPEERKTLMANAKAVLVPTLYLEPFGGVHAESLMSGTPVVTSDWGAFTETVKNGVGFRCRTLQEWYDAIKGVDQLETKEIARYGELMFSTGYIRFQYEDYFNRLLTLWDKGWYALK